MGADVDEGDGIFAAGRVRFKGKNDPAVILDPAGPEAGELPAQFVGFERRFKGVGRKLGKHLKDALL